MAKVKLLDTMTQSEQERNPCILQYETSQSGNLTVCQLHRAALLSDGGIASYPELQSLVSGIPEMLSYPSIIQHISSKISPLVDNLFLLSIKTSLTRGQRETHQQEPSFRIPIQCRPWSDPDTWKGYSNNNNSHVSSGTEYV